MFKEYGLFLKLITITIPYFKLFDNFIPYEKTFIFNSYFIFDVG